MNQAQGQRRKNRITAAALVLFAGAGAVGIGYSMADAGGVTLGIPQLCIALQAAIVSWIFFVAMRFMFLRERGYELKEGSYSDISWLNVDDNKLVVLGEESITCLTFEPTQVDSVVKLYASDSSCSRLINDDEKYQISRINWSDVTALISRSSDSSIDIETSFGLTSVQFINLDTKEHALKYLKAKLPTSALVVQKEHSNAILVIALLVGLLSFLTCALLVGSMAFTTVVGGISSLFFPLFLKALYEPNIETVTRVGQLYGPVQESNIPPSTSSVVPVTKSF